MFKLKKLLQFQANIQNNYIFYNLNLFKFVHTNVQPIVSIFDVVIIGAGAMGSSTAFWKKKKAGPRISVLVIDRDLTYKTSSTVLSVGGIRQQFSLKENVQLSSFGADFIKNVQFHLGENDDVDLQFKPLGYLTLATEKSKKILKENHENQLCWGGVNTLLLPLELEDRFPWLNIDGIALGCLGSKYEGWCDPWSLLIALRNQAKKLGAVFVEAVPCEFNYTPIVQNDGNSSKGQHLLNHVTIKSSKDEFQNIQFKTIVIATGADTGILTKDLLNLDKRSSGTFQFEVPVERRKRYVYCLETGNDMLNVPGSPMVIDPSGLYVRQEGVSNSYICGGSPNNEEDEPSIDNLDVDYDYFNEKLWPILAHRIPAFETLKVKSAWAGFYDYNSFDQNGIVGFHPAFRNMVLATGFSGHGFQHSPGVGRAVAELLLDGNFKTIDLSRFHFDRVIKNKPLNEVGII